MTRVDFKSVFKPNHYYIVTHEITCIIKTIRKFNTCDELWKLRIIKIFVSNDYRENHRYYVGLETNWYEDWCSNIREIKNIHDNSELLALVL